MAYRFSLLTVSVSFIQTVKTLGPLFTILFSRFMLDERLPLSRYLSVVPVLLGVAIVTVTEVEFAWVGAFAAVVSTVSQALLAVLSKQVLRAQEVSKSELFCMASFYAFAALLPLFLLLDAWRIPKLTNSQQTLATFKWLLLNGSCSAANQYTGLSVLDAMTSPLSHALANVMKRACVITIAMFVVSRPVTPLHAFGVALSVFGTIVYQQVDNCVSTSQDKCNFTKGEGLASDYELLPLRCTSLSPAAPRVVNGKIPVSRSGDPHHAQGAINAGSVDGVALPEVQCVVLPSLPSLPGK